jgi:acyl-CoA reductase-like NAD-dependent aldehyde dehydrogenase
MREAAAGQAAESEAEAPRRAETIAGIEADVRKAEAAVQRYMAAFESGRVSAQLFGERAEQLSAEAESLRARRAELLTTVTADSEALSEEALRAVQADLGRAEKHAPDTV